MKKLVLMLSLLLALLCVLAACDSARSITKSEIVNGELVLTYSDGTTENLGKVVGEKGDQGEKGDAGTAGTQGAAGATIAKVAFDEQGRLVVTLTDGTALTPVAMPEQAHQHTFGEWITAKAPTCADKGLSVHVCACGTNEVKELDITQEHVWDNGTITTPATLEQDGVKSFSCEICDAAKTEPAKAVTTVTAEEWDKALNLMECPNFDLDMKGSWTISGATASDEIADGTYEALQHISKNGVFLQMRDAIVGLYEETTKNYFLRNECLYSFGEQGEIWGSSDPFTLERHTIFSVADFRYDEATRCYVAEEIIFDYYSTSVSYTDVSLQFLDGKLIYVRYTQNQEFEGATCTFTAEETITYGTSALDPLFDLTVTEAEWENAMALDRCEKYGLSMTTTYAGNGMNRYTYVTKYGDKIRSGIELSATYYQKIVGLYYRYDYPNYEAIEVDEQGYLDATMAPTMQAFAFAKFTYDASIGMYVAQKVNNAYFGICTNVCIQFLDGKLIFLSFDVEDSRGNLLTSHELDLSYSNIVDFVIGNDHIHDEWEYDYDLSGFTAEDNQLIVMPDGAYVYWCFEVPEWTLGEDGDAFSSLDPATHQITLPDGSVDTLDDLQLELHLLCNIRLAAGVYVYYDHDATEVELPGDYVVECNNGWISGINHLRSTVLFYVELPDGETVYFKIGGMDTVELPDGTVATVHYTLVENEDSSWTEPDKLELPDGTMLEITEFYPWG